MRHGEAALESALRQVDRAVDQAEYEAESAYVPHPEIAGVCSRATKAANNLHAQLKRASSQGRSQLDIRHQGAKWLSDTSNAFIGRLGRYHPRDLDRLAGCLTRVESVVRMTPANLRRLRAAIARRLNMPAGDALYEDEGEEMLRRAARWFKGLVSGGKKPQAADPPPSSTRDSLAPVVIPSDADKRRKTELSGIITSLAVQISQLKNEGKPIPPQMISSLRSAIREARALGVDRLVDLSGPQLLVDTYSR